MTLLMSTVTTATPAKTTWAVDASHSNVEFSVRHLMIATVKGRFAGVTGTVSLDEEHPEQGTVDVVIDAASVDTRVAQRDEHLKSGDFFDVAQFPHLTFKSRQVTAAGDGEFVVLGDLTIRGNPHEVRLDVTSHGQQADPWGGRRAGFEATTRIK